MPDAITFDPRIEPQLAVKSLNQHEFGAWDDFVHRHPLGSPYHLSSWKTAIESAFPHIRGTFLVATQPHSDTIIAALPIYTVTSRILGHRLISVPFAAYCDPLLDGPQGLDLFLPTIKGMMADSNARRCELKTWRTNPSDPESGFRVSRRFLHHYIPLDADPETILRTFSPTSVRHMIAKGRGNAIRIEHGSGPQRLDDFYRIHVDTRVRLGLPPLPRSFFESLTAPSLPNPASLHFAFKSDQPVAAILSLRFRDMLAIEYAGDLPTHRKSGANQLLYWELIRNACLDGCHWLSLGRTGLDNPGLRAYKLHWNAREEELRTHVFPPPQFVPNGSTTATTARQIGRRLIRTAPNRLATWLGELCYRHLG